MKIAIVSIALNEEHFIARWADSAKDADYIILGDTGSTDNTIEVAKNNNVIVHNLSIKPWRFDDARNSLLALVPDDVDYVINLDVDEILIEGWRQHLENMDKYITRPRYKYVWSWKDDGSEGLVYGGDKIALRHNYRWKHPVHEVLIPDRIEEVQGWIGLEIHHYPDHSKSRGQYLPLLKLAVDEDPYDDRNAHYYARELFFNYRLDEAKQEFVRHLSLPRATWKPERAASMRYIAKCSYGAEREAWFVKAVEETPDRREPLVDLAQYYYETQEWDKCLEYSEKAIAITEKPLEYLCEDEAWGEKPYDLAAISSYTLGKYQKALEYGTQAFHLNPNEERLRTNLAFYFKKANDK